MRRVGGAQRMMDRAIDGLRVAHVGLTALAWIVIGMIDVEGGYAVLFGWIIGVFMAGCTYFLTRGSRARTIAVLAVLAALLVGQMIFIGAQGHPPIDYLSGIYMLMSLISLTLVGAVSFIRRMLR
jgi:hypothetical protein